MLRVVLKDVRSSYRDANCMGIIGLEQIRLRCIEVVNNNVESLDWWHWTEANWGS